MTKQEKIQEEVIEQEEKNKPFLNVRSSDVVINVWNNKRVVDDVEKEINSFQFEKIFKVGEDWKSTKSFNYSDIDKIIYVLQKLKEKVFPVTIQERK